MPKPDDRGSLMNLKTALPRVDPIQATEEMERRIMGNSSTLEGDRGKDVPIDLRKDISKDARGETHTDGHTLIGRRREGTVLLNAKVPLSLHTRLKRTSQFNDVSMTDILLRGIQSELESDRYSVPPDTWGTD